MAQALVAGLLQSLGERYRDEPMIDAGERLAIRSMVAAASAIGFTGTRRGIDKGAAGRPALPLTVWIGEAAPW